jgi:hypothetical protein
MKFSIWIFVCLLLCESAAAAPLLDIDGGVFDSIYYFFLFVTLLFVAISLMLFLKFLSSYSRKAYSSTIVVSIFSFLFSNLFTAFLYTGSNNGIDLAGLFAILLSFGIFIGTMSMSKRIK